MGRAAAREEGLFEYFVFFEEVDLVAEGTEDLFVDIWEGCVSDVYDREGFTYIYLLQEISPQF